MVTAVRKIRDPRSRTRIVEAAWRVLAERGLEGATVRAIASEAEVSTGFITHYFADKAELLSEVLQHSNTRSGTRVNAASEGKTGLAGLEAAVEALLPLDAERRREWLVWMAFWGEAAVEGGDLAAALVSASRYLEGMLAGHIREAVEESDLPEDVDLPYEAYRLVTLIAGIGLRAGVEPAGRFRKGARRILSNYFDELRRHAGHPLEKGSGTE